MKPASPSELCNASNFPLVSQRRKPSGLKHRAKPRPACAGSGATFTGNLDRMTAAAPAPAYAIDPALVLAELRPTAHPLVPWLTEDEAR